MAAVAANLDIAEEDLLRAQWYALLGRLLVAPPAPEALPGLAQLSGDDSAFGRAVSALTAAARDAAPAAVAEEYGTLFIGITHGELVPYASYYLTGFLHEKPLARLRSDMATLGIARADSVCEPEDHIGALCEMMAGLITGAFAAPADLATQRRFFEAHLAPWAPRFFEDLEAAAAARFYRPVGTIGRLFLAIELDGFAMTA